MGERVNFGFFDERSKNILFLYSHWGGGSHEEDLGYAISKAQGRWDDSGYATRIAISTLIADQWKSDTGFGLYINEVQDPNYDTQIVFWADRLVHFYEDYNFNPTAYKSMSFNEMMVLGAAGFIPEEEIN
jgi:hypothetical protein